ncbi:hypothetical protein M5K25_010216 [Dendrobium thyrsiflorum]|uniref:Uncharacterized protein n=1 Tax=Dendrobium thyrsiflorum TaxID=117978 RepID=A0ABD0UZL2_DENTH
MAALFRLCENERGGEDRAGCGERRRKLDGSVPLQLRHLFSEDRRHLGRFFSEDRGLGLGLLSESEARVIVKEKLMSKGARLEEIDDEMQSDEPRISQVNYKGLETTNMRCNQMAMRTREDMVEVLTM